MPSIWKAKSSELSGLDGEPHGIFRVSLRWSCDSIGYRVLERLVPFNCKELLYYDYNPLPRGTLLDKHQRTPSQRCLTELEEKVGVRHVEDLTDFLSQVRLVSPCCSLAPSSHHFLQCDVITVNCPLHEGTRDLLNKHTLSRAKKGVWIVNTARGAVCNAEAIAESLKSGHINGYAGDVWNHQPAPKNHIWRTMKNPMGGGNGEPEAIISTPPCLTSSSGMVPHYSGTTLDAQKRYAEGVRDILERYFAGEEQEPQNLIVQAGAYATKACEYPPSALERQSYNPSQMVNTKSGSPSPNQCSSLKQLYDIQSKLCNIS
jgi:formate dehydrogenase